VEDRILDENISPKLLLFFLNQIVLYCCIYRDTNLTQYKERLSKYEPIENSFTTLHVVDTFKI
jgi:hypothetical protein